MKKIAIAADHAGFEYKELIKKYKGLRSTIATSHYNMQVTINYPILTSKFKSAISENNWNIIIF